MGSHAWTARAVLHAGRTRTVADETAVYSGIKQELGALKLKISQIENLEDAAVCAQALARLWRIFNDVLDVEA